MIDILTAELYAELDHALGSVEPIADPLLRAAEIAAVIDLLEHCQAKLDALQLWQAGAHLDATLLALNHAC